MPPTKSTVRRIWKALGPGLTTGAADDDPSGIATYSQAGAQFGFALTWTILLKLPFMAAIQIISACIGWQTPPPRRSTRWLSGCRPLVLPCGTAKT
jgi:Mn2+/Fe2+ NRAMP family transporter